MESIHNNNDECIYAKLIWLKLFQGMLNEVSIYYAKSYEHALTRFKHILNR